jgi:putative hydrolase
MGRKRVEAIRDSLAGRFRRRGAAPSPPTTEEQRDAPPVSELLDVDEQYRRLVELDRLPKIAPRRFNPEGRAWLPILHTHRDARHYTALFSNTARAHELGTTRDWVVIYRDDASDHGQWTVITAGLGKLKGKRIIRGRETECLAHYKV